MGKIDPSLDPELLAKAEAAGVPVEAVIDAALRAARRKADEVSADARAAQWARENAEAIRAHHEPLAAYGVFGDDLRP